MEEGDRGRECSSLSAINPTQYNLSLRLKPDYTEKLANKVSKATQWGVFLRLKAPLICFVEAFILFDVIEQVTQEQNQQI